MNLPTKRYCCDLLTLYYYVVVSDTYDQTCFPEKALGR